MYLIKIKQIWMNLLMMKISYQKKMMRMKMMKNKNNKDRKK